MDERFDIIVNMTDVIEELDRVLGSEDATDEAGAALLAMDHPSKWVRAEADGHITYRMGPRTTMSFAATGPKHAEKLIALLSFAKLVFDAGLLVVDRRLGVDLEGPDAGGLN